MHPRIVSVTGHRRPNARRGRGPCRSSRDAWVAATRSPPRGMTVINPLSRGRGGMPDRLAVGSGAGHVPNFSRRSTDAWAHHGHRPDPGRSCQLQGRATHRSVVGGLALQQNGRSGALCHTVQLVSQADGRAGRASGEIPSRHSSRQLVPATGRRVWRTGQLPALTTDWTENRGQDSARCSLARLSRNRPRSRRGRIAGSVACHPCPSNSRTSGSPSAT